MLNKIHYAAHGYTAAEVVFNRVNAQLPFMGLTTFKGEKPIKNEVSNAKNYLNENELAVLNRMVSAFFDLAELRAMKHEPMYMKDWIVEIDDFSKRYGQGILSNAGQVSHQQALEKAESEYQKYRQLTVGELAQTEQDYIDSIKTMQKQIAGKK